MNYFTLHCSNKATRVSPLDLHLLTETNMIVVWVVFKARVTSAFESWFHVDTFAMVTHTKFHAHVVQAFIDITARGVFTSAVHTGGVEVSRSCQ